MQHIQNILNINSIAKQKLTIQNKFKQKSNWLIVISLWRVHCRPISCKHHAKKKKNWTT